MSPLAVHQRCHKAGLQQHVGPINESTDIRFVTKSMHIMFDTTIDICKFLHPIWKLI